MNVHEISKCLPGRLCVAIGLAVLATAVIAATPPMNMATMKKMMAPANGSAPHGLAVNETFLSHGRRMKLYSGPAQPIMLWQVATWCGSCKVGLQALAQHRALIDASNLKVVILRDYKNGGTPGPDMEQFVAQNAPTLLHDPHFIIGDDTATLFKTYDPRHFVDVYYLIAPSKRITVESSNPAITFPKIEHFIKAEAKA